MGALFRERKGVSTYRRGQGSGRESLKPEEGSISRRSQ